MTVFAPSLWSQSDKGSQPLGSLHREIDKLFDDFNRNFAVPSMDVANGRRMRLLSPDIDVVETDDAIELTAELPGVSEQDVDVAIADNVLTIRGEKKAGKTDEKKDYRIIERSFGSFQRAMRLPYKVDADAVSAQFRDGVLKVVLPKPPEMEAQSRKIAINASGN